MTRAWGSATKSLAGDAVRRTTMDARGPSRILEVTDLATNSELDVGLSSFGIPDPDGASEDLTNYICVVTGSPSTTTAATTLGQYTINDLDPTLRDGEPVAESTFQGPDAVNKVAYLHLSASPPFTNGVIDTGDASWTASRVGRLGRDDRLPLDTTDPALYAYVESWFVKPADRTNPPSCASGWIDSDPDSALVLKNRTLGTDADTHYTILKRASVDDPWVRLTSLPWATPTYSRTTLMLAQDAGKIVCRASSTTLEVWPIESEYDSITPDTLTLGASTLNWFDVWGPYVVVSRNDGEFESWRLSDATGFGVLSGIDTAAWTWGKPSFGWFAVTEPTRILFYRMADDGSGLTLAQTLEAGDDFSPTTVECCGADHAVSGTWDRLFLDHSTGLWQYGGEAAHIRRHYDAGGRWFGTYHRHIRMSPGTGTGFTDAVLAQVF